MRFALDPNGLRPGNAREINLGSPGPMRTLLAYNMDPGVLRPWLDTRNGVPTGRAFMTLAVRNDYDGQQLRDSQNNLVWQNVPINNAAATLRREDWLRIDEQVELAARARRRTWDDVYGANPLDVPNGFGWSAIEHAVAVGQYTATISMDPIRKGERARPTLDTTVTPLPVTHADGTFSVRQIAVSRNGGLPLDTTAIRMATISVLEAIDDLTLGTSSSYTYAGGTIYGLTNHPTRYTKTLTTPTGSNGPTVLKEFIQMVDTLRTNLYPGPYVAWYSNSYEQWLGQDYTTTYPMSLRTRIQDALPDVVFRRLDVLTGYQVIIAQMTPDVVQGVQGMPLTTVQWSEQGGIEEAFKVMTIRVPRIRASGNGTLGIIHGAV